MDSGLALCRTRGLNRYTLLLTESSSCELGHRDIKVQWKWAIPPDAFLLGRNSSGPKPPSSSVRTEQTWGWRRTERGGEQPRLQAEHGVPGSYGRFQAGGNAMTIGQEGAHLEMEPYSETAGIF